MITSAQTDEPPVPRLSIDRPDVFETRQSAQRPAYDQIDETRREGAKTEADLLLRGRPNSQI